MGFKILTMKGWIKFDEIDHATNLIKSVNNCLGLPSEDRLTLTWDVTTALCTLDPNSGATIFWGYVVKVDTDRMGQCLTSQQLSEIIQIPNDCQICGV